MCATLSPIYWRAGVIYYLCVAKLALFHEKRSALEYSNPECDDTASRRDKRVFDGLLRPWARLIDIDNRERIILHADCELANFFHLPSPQPATGFILRSPPPPRVCIGANGDNEFFIVMIF